MKRKDHGEIINRIFGVEFLECNDVPNIGSVKFELSYIDSSGIYHTAPEELTLADLEQYTLKDNEALLAKVYNSKGYIPALHGIKTGKSYGITRDFWNKKITEAINKPMLSPRDELLEEFNRKLRISTTTQEGYNLDAFEHFFSSMESMFEIMEGCEDQKVWQALYYAFNAGQWSRETYLSDEIKAITTAGLAQARNQRGRDPGAKNKSSKKKDDTQVKEDYNKKKKAIVDLWSKTNNKNAYHFMDLLKELDPPLAIEKDYHYQVAGKGKFLKAEDATRKIRGWHEKMP